MWLVVSLQQDSLGGWVPAVPETIPARATPPPYIGRAGHGQRVCPPTPPPHGGAGLSLLCMAFTSPTGGGRTQSYYRLRAMACVSLITPHALRGCAVPVTPSLSYIKCIGLCSVLPPPLANSNTGEEGW